MYSVKIDVSLLFAIVLLLLSVLHCFFAYLLEFHSELFDLVIDLFEVPRVPSQHSLHHFAVFHQHIRKRFQIVLYIFDKLGLDR